MQDYPNFYVSTEGYDPVRSDGSELIRAENGEAWIYRAYDTEQITFTIVHQALTREEENQLRDFYAAYRHEHVRYYDPRYDAYFIVLMAGPPRLLGMRGGMLADVQMTLVGVAE